MSENGDDDERGWSAMLNSEIDEQGSDNEHKGEPYVSDFIRYSDSVDERMLGMVNRRKEASEINFNSWDRRDFHELSSESEEESPLASSPRRYPVFKERKGGTENRTKTDSSIAKTNDFERQYQQQNEEVLVNEGIRPSETQELVKKFRTIELLREKENSKQVHENEAQKPNFSTQRASQEEEEIEQETNLEEFFGLKRLGKKRINMWKGKENMSGTSDGSLSGEERDKDIDDLVELLSSTSLIKIYDENLALPKEEEEILNTFLQSEEKENPLERGNNIYQKNTVEYLNDLFENVPETTTQKTSRVPLDDESDWKASESEERCTSLNGYDDDNQGSFHDWVLHEIFLKSPDPELTLCSNCFSIHGSSLECF